MERQKLLTICVVALLLLNAGTLTFLFLNSSKDGDDNFPHRPEPKDIIIEKLHFDKDQQQKYDELIHWHRTEISTTEEKIRESKNALYLLLTDPNQKQKDSLIENLAQLQKEIENIHFKHFQAIKKLCNKEHLKDFDSLALELSRIFSKPPRHRN